MLDSCGHETLGWLYLYRRDSKFSTTYQILLEGKQVVVFHLQGTLLCHLGHLCVPSSKHAKMILEENYSWVARHFGVEKIVAVLQKYFCWMNLRHDIGRYIKSCIFCSIAKPTIKKKGLYTPRPTPNWPWESISMDYMSGFPSTKHGHEYTFMVINIFSKMAILAACKKSIVAEETTKIFFE